ncbi:CAMK/CAMKL protein kinase [Phytophthora nicotianae P10297]|uniref:CAMK/CAMKL protein kinase n=2 Tax=Phytophthora nicotianae TaxID=4792 RepID=W2Z6Z5_PHYNI|nr:CAMK/CAMKL protein kinase [Phytophthora nicotianae]ETP43142.1 CAMK/CAMKL protein kinase [Phytophthora nicotianae P10297]
MLDLTDKVATPRRLTTRRPVRCIREATADGPLKTRTRRVNRLDCALQDARGNSGYSGILARQRSVKKITTEDQLQSVYDRVEQHNNSDALTQLPSRLSTLSTTQLKLAEQAVQTFIDKMRQTVDTADKFDLIRTLDDTVNQLDDLTCWYSVGNEIGRGTFGRVRSATHRLSGTPVAIKSYSRLHGARSCLPVDDQVNGGFGGDAFEWRRVRQEVRILSRLRAHPNIMRFVEVFESPTRIHVVTELLKGTSLCEILRRAPGQRLSETRAKRIFQQLVTAVEVLHSQCVIHRDLKLENVLLDEQSGHVTVIDFGFSDLEESIDLQTLDPAENEARKKQLKKKNFCGTPAYMAPEVVARERGAQHVVLPPTLSGDVRALLQSILTVDPAKRPSASELRHCSWLQNVEAQETPQNLLISFEAWPGTNQRVCEALTELYGVQPNHSDSNITRRHRRLSAFVKLAIAESSHHFQKIVVEGLASDDIQTMQSEETDTESQKNQEDAESSSTRHKQQLEKLIGLVKTSLATR